MQQNNHPAKSNKPAHTIVLVQGLAGDRHFQLLVRALVACIHWVVEMDELYGPFVMGLFPTPVFIQILISAHNVNEDNLHYVPHKM